MRLLNTIARLYVIELNKADGSGARNWSNGAFDTKHFLKKKKKNMKLLYELLHFFLLLFATKLTDRFYCTTTLANKYSIWNYGYRHLPNEKYELTI